MGCNTYLYTAIRRRRSFVPVKTPCYSAAVRLRGCVAIELFVGAIATAAVAGAAIWGLSELRGAMADENPVARASRPADRGARAGRATGSADPAPAADDPATAGATRLAAAAVRGETLPVSSVAAGERGEPAEPVDRADATARPPWSGVFLGRDDESLLAPLRDSPVKAVKLNRGGSSLSLRLDFDSGGRAACKPNQVYLQSQPRREIAAYRINRLLGLSSVAPSLGRRFRVTDLADSFRPDARRDRTRFVAEVVPERDDGDAVLGELTWWVPDLQPGTIEGFEIDSTEGVVTWKRYLTVGNDISPASLPVAAQISELVLFDFLINNSDRWSGGNIKSSGGRSLVFLDNTLSFGGDPNGHTRARTYLYRSQKFSRRLIERLRQLGEEELREALTRDIDPFPLLLEKYEIRALLKRRDYALRYVDDLIQQHGDGAVLAFP